ncbi:hypothetical protein [Bifidobacterium polysaccharolyticum]|uniref:hypothetical protein n=1 Tax=Bifidobacterium polysaccharolyticum TaxID=2750967 RepID=UPI0018DE7D6F|nr:hypothetical protein [Bifidobacterium polysaccharolyticum]MBI0064198.1 hypothetical protein [Bifidobacterium polysaccharolyticum]
MSPAAVSVVMHHLMKKMLKMVLPKQVENDCCCEINWQEVSSGWEQYVDTLKKTSLDQNIKQEQKVYNQHYTK